MKGISKESRIGFIGTILFHAILIIICLFSTLGSKVKLPDYVDLSFIAVEAPPVVEEAVIPEATADAVSSTLKISKSSPAGMSKPEKSSIVKSGVPASGKNAPKITPPRYNLAFGNEKIRFPESKLDVNDSRNISYNSKLDVSSSTDKGMFSQNRTGDKITRESGTSSSGISSSGVSSSGISAPGNSSIGKEIRGYSIAWRNGGNRNRVSGSMPRYPENTNKEAQIKVKITVTPDGSVSQITPLQKADYAFENAVMSALRTWKFEKLSANRSAENQTGIITFNFKLD